MRKIYFSIVFFALCALTNPTALVAQIAHDRITFIDSSKIMAIVKAVQPPQIQYNDYDIATQKEGATHTVVISQVAYIQYANGRVERNADWQATFNNLAIGNVILHTVSQNTMPRIASPQTASPQNGLSQNAVSKTVPVSETSYEQAFIPKINLTNLALGNIHIGAEYTLNKNFSVEAYLGYAGQGDNKKRFSVYENGIDYTGLINIKSGGLFSDFVFKWYPGLHNQTLNYFFQTDYHNAAPHGWNLALREQFIAANTTITTTYDNSALPVQVTNGTAVATATTLNVGYQQSRIFKALTLETYLGLGIGHRTSSAFNVITPAGVPLEVIKPYNDDLLAFSYGLTIGVDINAFKKNLK